MTPLALDIAIASIILLSTVVAYMRGIIKEMFTIVGLLVAAFIAYKLGHVLVPEFNTLLNVPESGASDKADYVLFGLLSPAVASMAAAYGSTFAVVLLVVLLLGRMFSKWVKDAGMEIVDKVLGGAFGFLRGFLVVFVIYIPFNFLIDNEDMPDWAKESHSVMAFEGTYNWLSKEISLEDKIEERSEGVVIKFDKIDPSNVGEEKSSYISDTLDTISDGAAGVADTLKDAITMEDEAEAQPAKEEQSKKRNRLIETREEYERNNELEEERRRLEELKREEQNRLDEKKHLDNERRRREAERQLKEKLKQQQEIRRQEEQRQIEEMRRQREEFERQEKARREEEAVRREEIQRREVERLERERKMLEDEMRRKEETARTEEERRKRDEDEMRRMEAERKLVEQREAELKMQAQQEAVAVPQMDEVLAPTPANEYAPTTPAVEEEVSPVGDDMLIEQTPKVEEAVKSMQKPQSSEAVPSPVINRRYKTRSTKPVIEAIPSPVPAKDPTMVDSPQVKSSEVKADEYIPSPSINSFRKTGDFVEQKKTPEDFYNPNNPEEKMMDEYAGGGQ